MGKKWLRGNKYGGGIERNVTPFVFPLRGTIAEFFRKTHYFVKLFFQLLKNLTFFLLNM